MLGDFTYCTPTKLYFGPAALDGLNMELTRYGANVQFVYGGGSIKKSGLYDQVMQLFSQHGKTVVEDAGVMPNPTLGKLLEGVEIGRAHQVDFILAVGGGSVIDYAKAVSISIHAEGDVWQQYFVDKTPPTCDIVPVGCVLTMAGTGSEMNGGAVITNTAQKLKLDCGMGEEVFPKFSILNPELTFSLPRYQMVAGCFDVLSHIMEQYFSGFDDNTSDYVMEGLMRSLIHSSRVAVQNPRDYEARSNIMWAATWGLNSMIGMGKSQDWMVHRIGQSMGAFTDATHGMTLAAVSPAYYRHMLPYAPAKFARFAQVVWGVDIAGKDEAQVAEEGLRAMETWMREIGLVMHAAELGVTEDMLDGIADGAFPTTGGYHVLDHAETVAVLRESM